MADLTCSTCGEPLSCTDVGLIGIGGVCRDPWNPNQDDEGQHLAVPPERPYEHVLSTDETED